MFKVLILVSLLVMAALACTIGTGGAPAPTAAATVPPDQVVAYRLPIYTATLKPGETVKGSKLTYVGREGDVYNVTIGGLPAAKRVGDSFAWKGVTAPGVIGDFKLRISPTLRGDDLLAAGTAEILVLNPIPVELNNDFNVAESLLHFSNIAVDYEVPIGAQIPGTTLLFEAATDSGAQLDGTKGFPIRALGDSLIWTGRLRGNVVVRYSLRVASLNENSLRLVGTAELWITSMQ